MPQKYEMEIIKVKVQHFS